MNSPARSSIDGAMTAPTTAGLARFNPAQPGARGMKIAATGLLVVMAAAFFTARA